MRIPELGVKNSRLADRVVGAFRSAKNKYELAHELVDIADKGISRQMSRDTIDLAIDAVRAQDEELDYIEVTLTKRDIALLQRAVDDWWRAEDGALPDEAGLAALRLGEILNQARARRRVGARSRRAYRYEGRRAG